MGVVNVAASAGGCEGGNGGRLNLFDGGYEAGNCADGFGTALGISTATS